MNKVSVAVEFYLLSYFRGTFSLLRHAVFNVLCFVIVANCSSAADLFRKCSQQFPGKKVHSVKIDCKVASRFAHTVMTSTALNKANVSQEVFFEVELPKTAFITNFSMSIDGQIFTGEVKEKEKAKKQYETAVSSGQTAGLVKASGRKMEKFSVSVNIAAHSNVTFALTYEELLQRRFGKYEIMIRVKPKQLVQQFQIVADIYEPQSIDFLDINATFITNELLPLVEKTVTDKTAHVSFSPTLDQQRKCPDCDGTLIDGDFFITYDVKRDQGIGDIQVKFGISSLISEQTNVAVSLRNSLPPSVISASLSGTKEALVTILDDLSEEDHFGLVTFDDKIEFWRPSLSKATPHNVKEAKQFVRSITARQMTDINGAVMHAVDMLTTAKENNSLPASSASMIILLTDGEPTAGEDHLPTIQENVRKAIDGQMSLFCLGFGYDVDYPFLDVMAKQNDGLARRIYEASDATLQLQDFYEEVASPLLLEVHLHYPGNAVNSLTNSYFRQLFNGSEVVVAGQVNDFKADNILIEVFQKTILWSEILVFPSFSSMDLQVTKDRSLTVSLRNSVKFVIILHKVWKEHPYHQDYLGFYTLDSHLLSQRVHGVIGQFFHGVNFEVSNLVEGQDPDKPDAIMFVKGHTLKVTRGWQRDFRKNVKNGENVSCWFIHNNGTGLIDGVLTDYIVSDIFSTV
uniref:Inter-alpha-trypsin inhibitor heavy chain H3 n=1 Tax=Electrophorus electricus TaxID=8005 RepID=A0A4W4E7W5_ELEEL